MTVTVREARAEEAEALTELAMRAKASWGYDAAFMAACRDELTLTPQQMADWRIWVAELGGQVAGMIALSLDDGAVVWRAYGTGPDADVLIGPRFKPFYAKDRGVDLGVHSWPGEAWKQGGATAWGWMSYDPLLNLVYYSTSPVPRSIT